MFIITIGKKETDVFVCLPRYVTYLVLNVKMCCNLE